MSGRLLFALAVALGLLACRRDPARPGGEGSSSSLTDEVQALLASGEADAALARLQGEPAADAEVLFLKGLAWARKAETAPLPTPDPADPGGAVPALKHEEAEALSFLEQAGAARPDLAAAHLALADLLAPHVLRRQAEELAAAGRAGRTRDAPRPLGPAGPDLSVERVIQAYRRAAQADRVGKPVVEAWIEFARKAGRLDEVDAAFLQLLQRDRENAEPFIRYGDFLALEKKDGAAAIAQYSQALIWQPSLDEARAKIADIYLDQAAGHYERKEYATAQARLAEAKRYLGGSDSPQAARFRQIQGQLAAIRGR
jgi:hypothetical protein